MHSKKALRAQFTATTAALFLVAVFFWAVWLSKPDRSDRLIYPVAGTSLLFPTLGACYYMLQKNRRIMMDRFYFSISGWGIRSMTPAGEAVSSWEDVLEVRVGSVPSLGRSPDVIFKTRRGHLFAFMRYVPKDGEIPEVSLLRGGRTLIYSNGERRVTASTSELLASVVRLAPSQKIRQGVII